MLDVHPSCEMNLLTDMSVDGRSFYHGLMVHVDSTTNTVKVVDITGACVPIYDVPTAVACKAIHRIDENFYTSEASCLYKLQLW
jgi:hypothetical protein